MSRPCASVRPKGSAQTNIRHYDRVILEIDNFLIHHGYLSIHVYSFVIACEKVFASQ
jgi:hypothetical protein